MNRSQILLDDWQFHALKARAEREGTSLSALVREAVTQYLATGEETGASVESIAGIGSDVHASGRHHDSVLYGGALGAAQPSRTSAAGRRRG